MSDSVRKYIAELFGTAVLVILGCGAATLAGGVAGTTAMSLLGIAFAFGLAVTAMAYGIGPISGCHINPAVTLGFLACGRIAPGEAVGYIVAQFIGALAGAGILLVMLTDRVAGYDLAAGGLGQNGWGAGYLGGYGMLAAALAEFIGTFIFVYVILQSTNPGDNLEVAGLIIGLTLFLIHVVFINVTGVSVNPARSFGPAVLVGGKALAQLWLFIVVPAVAGLAAGSFFRGR